MFKYKHYEVYLIPAGQSITGGQEDNLGTRSLCLSNEEATSFFF